ncbi:MAG: archaeal heat shock protein Hsp14 [Nitrosopumilaceae archaeon]
MGLIKHMAKEAIREIGNKSREFYEFVLPPIDMHLENNNLIITIDIPGFKKEDIKLSIHRNILSISAQKKEKSKTTDGIICQQRPNIIDKKIRLPMRIKEGEEKVNSAKYTDGVLVITIPVNTRGKNITIE